MNADELKVLTGTLAMYSAYYRVKFEDQVLKMYADDLADLSLTEVVEALKRYRKDPKNRQMPLPAQIRAIVSPEVDAESAAKEIAARVSGAVVKFGWANAKDAETFIGPIGWDIVRRYGGWMHICQNHGLNIDQTAFSAQVRELAKASIQFPTRKMEQAIGLNPANNREGLQRLGEIMGVNFLNEPKRDSGDAS